MQGSDHVEAGSALIYVPTRTTKEGEGGGVPYEMRAESECGETYTFDFREWLPSGFIPKEALHKLAMCRTLAVQAVLLT